MPGKRWRLLGALITGCCCLSLVACSQTATTVRGPATHKVRKGETLYAIAWRYQLNYRDLSRWNSIPSPYTIYPGQYVVLQPPGRTSSTDGQETSLLRLPEPPPKQRETASAPQTTAKRTTPQTAKKTTRPLPTVAAETPQRSRPAGTWLWPTAGKVVKQFDGREKRSLGVDIAGNEGQKIRATAGGRVVYSGSGIPTYGRLIIVKHDAAYLSAYAHNRKLLVSEGAEVRAGQVIAEMGRDDDNRQILHFEIRKNGKPVNPLRYLRK